MPAGTLSSQSFCTHSSTTYTNSKMTKFHRAALSYCIANCTNRNEQLVKHICCSAQMCNSRQTQTDCTVSFRLQILLPLCKNESLQSAVTSLKASIKVKHLKHCQQFLRPKHNLFCSAPVSTLKTYADWPSQTLLCSLCYSEFHLTVLHWQQSAASPVLTWTGLCIV